MKTLRLAVAAFLAAASFAFPQEPAPAEPPKAAPEPPKTLTTERSIFVPFEKLEEVFEGQERGVFLPYREFLEMWNKLNLPEKLKTKEPPVEGVLASANYVGRVEGEVAEIKAKLSFEALKEGWSRLPLGAGGLSIAEAKSTALLNFADGAYEMLFPQRGAYTLDATIHGRVTPEGGRSVLKLRLPKTAVSQFELTIPDKGLDFTITPASAYSAAENPDGTTRLVVYFGASEDVNIAWSKRAAATALAPLLFAEAATDIRLSAGVVRADVTVTYRILRAPVAELAISVPDGFQVLAVEGQEIKEWTIAPGAAANAPQPLVVRFHAPVRDTYTLTLRLEAPLGALPQTVRLPEVRATGVERQSGTVKVSADPELVAEISDLQGLTQQAAAPAAKGAPGGLIGQYRYLRLPFGGTVAVSEATPQIEVTSRTLLTVATDALQLYATFSYSVKKAGIFTAAIELPAGFAKADATGEQVESSTVADVDGKKILNVKFTGRRTGEFSFLVTGEALRTKADEPVIVPVLTPQNVERYDARVGLAIHVSLKAVTADKGDLREQDIGELSDLPVADPSATPLTLGFRYRGVAKPAQVTFELRKPRVSAEVLTLVEVREALLRHTWTLAYNIEYAGVDELAIEVPKAIGDDIQIDGENIKERIKSETKDADGAPTGTTTWRVLLQDKTLGGYELTLTHDAARGDQKPGALAPVALQEIRPVNLFRETGQVAVVKDGNLEFVKTDAKGLETIDPKELRETLQQDDVFLAYKYAAHPIALALDVSKNLYLDVPQAVVSYAVLTSVIAEDQAETTEVIYWVRNNAQQFFSVQLPGEGKTAAKLLSDAFVNGEPQQPSRRPDKNELLIRLPAKAESNEAFPVRFVYEVPSPKPGRKLGWRGAFKIQPPQLGGVEVLQTKWTLYLPNDHRFVSFGGAMREEVGRRGWERARRLFTFFLPQVGPAPIGADKPALNEPPALPAAKSAGFDTQIQKEGVRVVLRRLDAPAEVRVAYRGKAYAATIEALFAALAFFGGVSLLRATRQARFAYFMFVGIGAVIIAGAVNPRATGLWQAIAAGVFAAALVWLAAAFWKPVSTWPERWRTWRTTPRPPKPPHPLAAHAAAPAAATASAPQAPPRPSNEPPAGS